MPDVRPSSFNLVTTPGSYWIYQWYRIDTLGLETPTFQDSIYVVGDTVINNNTFTLYAGTEFNQSAYEIYRDSLGFIVNSKGVKLWNKNAIGPFSSNSNDVATSEASMINNNSTITVPAGTFASLEKSSTFCLINGNPVTPCAQCFTGTSNYVEGVGEIIRQVTFVGSQDCSQLERRLIRYKIQ